MDFIIIYPDIYLRKANTQDNRENLNGNGRKEEYSPLKQIMLQCNFFTISKLTLFSFQNAKQ